MTATTLTAALLLVLISTTASATISPTEELFLNVPDAESTRRNLRFITSVPHVAGTTGDHVMANFVVQQFEEAGIPNVSVFDLDVLLNYPESSPRVAMLSTDNKVLFEASMSENVLEFDDTSDTPWRNHTFHGYSPSGNVTAPLVYANYGRPQDFDALEAAGIFVKDKIVIVRYGQCFRGLKVMNAQERGASAVIIYSDPANDGFQQGQVYPDGPWRSASSVQRGSVQFNSKCAGDPMRADKRYGESVSDLCGVDDYTDLIPSIPSVPMSYGDAMPLLQRMGGKSAKEVGGDDFCGGLNITYTVGPSKDTLVNLVVNNQEAIRSIPNVVGYISGTLEPERDMPVLLGNHRDAWVYGAADPNSGTASLIEVARGLGKLLETGWKPLRSIYLLSWSGEEYGLLGSTGWAELNQNLIERAVAYLNVDTVVSGDLLSVATTPALGTAWEQVLNDLHASTTHAVPFGNGLLGEIVDGNTNWVLNHPEWKILGSGSDYTAFLDHFGIASIDFSFGKTTTYGQYHSIYDSFSWMDAYGGRDNEKGSAFELMAFSAKIWGLLALRLADSNVLPLDHVVQGKALGHYADSIRQQQDCVLDFELLDETVKSYQEAAAALHAACSSNELYSQKCNEKLGLTERQFLSQEGLPNRKWFKHVLQAPGMYLGYAAEAFPGVQQAIDAGDCELAQEQVQVAAKRVEAAASFLGTDNEATSQS